MMRIQLGHDVLNKVCEALGIESMEVSRVLIDINAKGFATVYTSQRIQERQFDDLLKVLANVETIGDSEADARAAQLAGRK